MKKLMIFPLAALAFASCSSDDEPCVKNDDRVEIRLSADVNEVKTKAPVNSGASVTAQFVASATTGDYTTNAWTASATFTASTTASASFSFSPAQYYSPTGSTIYIKGFYPAGTVSGKTVTFTGMNGSQDLMISNEQSGSKASATPLAFNFSHLLTQLQFNLVAGTGFGTGITVTKIVVRSQQTPQTLDLNAGTVAYNTAADVSINGNYAITSGGSTATDYPMFKAGNSIVLSVTTSDGVTYPDATITGLTTAVGQAHLITLTFTPLQITATATVAAWGTGGTGSSTLS